MDREERVKLLAKFQQGQATPKETEALEKYADELISNYKGKVFVSDLEKDSIKKELLKSIAPPLEKRDWSWLRVAASIVVFVGLSLSLWLLRSSLFGPEMITVQTAPGEHRTVILEDGSSVVLNSASTLEYPKTFSATSREINLTGEALFSVTKDPARPFVVESNELETTVLGTVFNVNAYPEDSIVQVSLLEGAVRVDQDDEQMLLKPTEQSTFYVGQQGLIKSEFVEADILAWQENNLVFSKTSFAQIRKLVARKYGVELQFAQSEIARFTISGKFEDPDLNTLLATICTAKSLNYKAVSENQILISRR